MSGIFNGWNLNFDLLHVNINLIHSVHIVAKEIDVTYNYNEVYPLQKNISLF